MGFVQTIGARIANLFGAAQAHASEQAALNQLIPDAMTDEIVATPPFSKPGDSILIPFDVTALQGSVRHLRPIEDPVATEVRNIISELPAMIDEEGAEHNRPFGLNGIDVIRRFFEGSVTFPRCEAIHRLLCGEAGPEETSVIINGPGAFPLLIAATSQLGSRTTVKELDHQFVRVIKKMTSRFMAEDHGSRIEFIQDSRKVDYPGPGPDIVYWNTPYELLVRGYNFIPSKKALLKGENISSYLGRDVKPGGYLVIQAAPPTIFDEYYETIPFDGERWDDILNMNIPDGIALPTTQSYSDITLRILRRKG